MRFVLAFAFAIAACAAAPAGAVSASDGQLLTSMVATAAGSDARLDVLTASDVKKALDVEASKSLMGCDAAAGSCLAEIAQAMDASAVLHGSVGTLGDDVVLTLSLFDASRATAVGRVTAKDKSIATLGDRVNATVVQLLKDVPAVEGKKIRVLVLDLDVVDAPSAPAAAPFPWAIVGGGVAAVGVVGLLVAVGSEVAAADAVKQLGDKGTFAAQVPALVDQRNTAVAVGDVAWIAGGALVVLGGAVAVGALVLE